MFENKYPVVMSEIFTEYTFIKATVYTNCEVRKKKQKV